MEKQIIDTQDKLPLGDEFVQRIFNIVMDRSGKIEIPAEQRERIRRYFEAMDRAVMLAEQNRIKKNKNNKEHKYDETLEYKWSNIRVDNELAHALLDCAKLGLDMSLPNHLSPVLYKDKANQQYVFSFIPGYRGYEMIAHKYALVDFIDVKIELIYSNDKFIPHKADKNNPYDTYELEISNPFDRGEFVGGFAYVIYEDQRRNTLHILTKKDIEKRKPQTASANFWGGTTTEWVNGKSQTVEKDGWYEEMAKKTIAIYAYKRIPSDPQKIDAAYRNVSESNTVKKDFLDVDAEVSEAIETAKVVDIPTAIPEKISFQQPVSSSVPLQEEVPVEKTAPKTVRPSWMDQ